MIQNSRARSLALSGLAAAFPIGFAGIASGFLTGESRSPAVGAAVPAVLTFMGLVVVYLVGKGSYRSMIAGFAVIVFSFQLLFGVALGTASRNQWEEWIGSVGYQRSLASEEFQIRAYRTALGLPPQVPTADQNNCSSDKP